LPASFEWSGGLPAIRQVLVNLVGNAVKFTPAGTIIINVWVGEADAGASRQLWFSVSDTGNGIPLERQADIFEPFVQLDNHRLTAQAGTGLGLPISRKLVEAMGGQIMVRSQPGLGATFEFWVPQ
jgi:signal transduction histidine kinase